MLMRPLLLLITILFVNSCQNNKKASVKDSEENNTRFVSDIVDKVKYDQFGELAKRMNLSQLESSEDSFELRLWVSTMFVEKDLMVLGCKHGVWNSKRIVYRKIDDSITSKEVIIQSDYPLPKLVDSLKSINFKEFPSQNEIQGFVDNIADGAYYNLEIKLDNIHKIISYHCPESFAKNDPYNRHFLSIIKLLDKYFNFYSPVCKE